MIERPTSRWRGEVHEQKLQILAGTLAEDADEAYAAHLWPSDFLDEADAALDAYEQEMSSLQAPTDVESLAAVERVVLALNAVNDKHGSIETGEREEFCQYIESVLAQAGVDLDALTSRMGVGRHELTDEWREW